MFDLAFAIRFLLASLALYRVAMFTREDGPFGIFLTIREKLGRRVANDTGHLGMAWTLAEISNCPLCLGVWLAFLFAPAVIWPSIITDIVLIVLALAGLQSLMTGRSSEE